MVIGRSNSTLYNYVTAAAYSGSLFLSQVINIFRLDKKSTYGTFRQWSHTIFSSNSFRSNIVTEGEKPCIIHKAVHF